jgi:hypothetical protein
LSVNSPEKDDEKNPLHISFERKYIPNINFKEREELQRSQIEQVLDKVMGHDGMHKAEIVEETDGTASLRITNQQQQGQSPMSTLL